MLATIKKVLPTKSGVKGDKEWHLYQYLVECEIGTVVATSFTEINPSIPMVVTCHVNEYSKDGTTQWATNYTISNGRVLQLTSAPHISRALGTYEYDLKDGSKKSGFVYELVLPFGTAAYRSAQSYAINEEIAITLTATVAASSNGNLYTRTEFKRPQVAEVAGHAKVIPFTEAEIAMMTAKETPSDEDVATCPPPESGMPF